MLDGLNELAGSEQRLMCEVPMTIPSSRSFSGAGWFVVFTAQPKTTPRDIPSTPPVTG